MSVTTTTIFRQNFLDLLSGKIEFPHDFTIVVGITSSDLPPPIYNGSVLDSNDYIYDCMVFRVHKVILATNSEYFRNMFTTGCKESSTNQTEIPNIEPRIFLEILRFIYTGEHPSIGYNYLEDGIDLALAADYFQLPDLHQNTITVLQEHLKRYIDKTPYATLPQSKHYDNIVFYLLDQKVSDDTNIIMYLINHFRRLDSESKLTFDLKNQLLLKLIDFHISCYSR